MNKEAMRRADFKTGIILIVLSVLVLVETSTFPMTDSYGGVQNVWYVSPALFPLIIGGVLLVLSVVLLANAIREGGHRGGAGTLSPRRLLSPSEHTVRFGTILLYLLAYVYLFVPYVDFALATFLFLFPFALSFYVDRPDILKKMALIILGLSVIMAVLLLSGVWPRAVESFEYAFEIPLAVLAIAVPVYARRLIGDDPLLARRFLITLIVAIASPLFLFLAFRYGLRVQMPHEGLVADAAEAIRYFFRTPGA